MAQGIREAPEEASLWVLICAHLTRVSDTTGDSEREPRTFVRSSSTSAAIGLQDREALEQEGAVLASTSSASNLPSLVLAWSSHSCRFLLRTFKPPPQSLAQRFTSVIPALGRPCRKVESSRLVWSRRWDTLPKEINKTNLFYRLLSGISAPYCK